MVYIFRTFPPFQEYFRPCHTSAPSQRAPFLRLFCTFILALVRFDLFSHFLSFFSFSYFLLFSFSSFLSFSLPLLTFLHCDVLLVPVSRSARCSNVTAFSSRAILSICRNNFPGFQQCLRGVDGVLRRLPGPLAFTPCFTKYSPGIFCRCKDCSMIYFVNAYIHVYSYKQINSVYSYVSPHNKATLFVSLLLADSMLN